MKKSVSDLLNNCQPQELDSFLDAVTVKMPEEADGDRIRALAMQKAGVSPKRRTQFSAIIGEQYDITETAFASVSLFRVVK